MAKKERANNSMRYLTKISMGSSRLENKQDVELFRHVIELNNGNSVCVDETLDYHKTEVRREYCDIKIFKDYRIDTNKSHFATILLAVELVKFIDTTLETSPNGQ